MDSIPEKQCSKCKQFRPATTEYFEPLKTTLRKDCRECRKEYKRQMEFVRRQNEYVKEADRARSPSRRASRAIYNKKYVQTDAYRECDRKRSNTQARKDTERVAFNNRKARRYGLPDTFTTEEWRQCLKYWDYRCAVCGRTAGFWTAIAADHWIPLTNSNCPGTVATNMIPLCHGLPGVPVGEPCCNGNKFNKNPSEWLIDRLGKRKGKEKLIEILSYFEWVKSCA